MTERRLRLTNKIRFYCDSVQFDGQLDAPLPNQPLPQLYIIAQRAEPAVFESRSELASKFVRRLLARCPYDISCNSTPSQGTHLGDSGVLAVVMLAGLAGFLRLSAISVRCTSSEERVEIALEVSVSTDLVDLTEPIDLFWMVSMGDLVAVAGEAPSAVNDCLLATPRELVALLATGIKLVGVGGADRRGDWMGSFKALLLLKTLVRGLLALAAVFFFPSTLIVCSLGALVLLAAASVPVSAPAGTFEALKLLGLGATCCWLALFERGAKSS